MTMDGQSQCIGSGFSVYDHSVVSPGSNTGSTDPAESFVDEPRNTD